MQILKFPLKVKEGHLPVIMTPPGSTVLDLHMMPEGWTAWASCPTPKLACSEPHHFVICQTGQDVPDALGDCRFIKTAQFMAGQPVKIKISHIFEVPGHLVQSVTNPIIA